MIGNDPSGNAFVEVLHGEFKSWIGCIDHDLYLSCDTIADYFEDMGLGDHSKLSDLQRYQSIFSESSGLINFHARSFREFTDNCFFEADDEIVVANLDTKRA